MPLEVYGDSGCRWKCMLCGNVYNGKEQADECESHCASRPMVETVIEEHAGTRPDTGPLNLDAYPAPEPMVKQSDCFGDACDHIYKLVDKIESPELAADILRGMVAICNSVIAMEKEHRSDIIALDRVHSEAVTKLANL